MPIGSTPATVRSELPRDREGEIHVHRLRLEVCCTSETADGFLVLDEYRIVSGFAEWDVPELDEGFYYAAALHSGGPVGSQPLVASEGFPMPEPGVGVGLVAGALLLAALVRSRATRGT